MLVIDFLITLTYTFNNFIFNLIWLFQFERIGHVRIQDRFRRWKCTTPRSQTVCLMYFNWSIRTELALAYVIWNFNRKNKRRMEKSTGVLLHEVHKLNGDQSKTCPISSITYSIYNESDFNANKKIGAQQWISLAFFFLCVRT